MLWSVPLAHAIAAFDSGGSCNAGGDVIFSIPAADATGVPLDIAPAFVFSPNGCGELQSTLTLAEAESGAVVSTDTVDVSQGLGGLDPETELAPSTAFTFTSATDFAETAIGFTTGTVTSTPAGVIPTVESVTASWMTDPAELQVDATVTYSGSGGGDLIAQWRDGPRDSVVGSAITRTGAPGRTDSGSWVSAHVLTEAPAEWCVSARTRELDGTWVDGEPVCVEVESAALCGCSTAKSGAPLAGIAAAALALFTRRRARG